MIAVAQTLCQSRLCSLGGVKLERSGVPHWSTTRVEVDVNESTEDLIECVCKGCKQRSGLFHEGAHRGTTTTELS